MMICETAKKGECEYEWAGPCDRRSPHDQDGYCFTPKCVSDGTRCTERCVPETPEYVRNEFRVEPEPKASTVKSCSNCSYRKYSLSSRQCSVCDISNHSEWKPQVKPKKETKVKYTQTKPISLEKLWDAQTAKACVDFLKEWAVFMNWIAQSNRCPTWDTEFDHTFGTFMRDMKNNPHATTWLGYLEKHGFIKKEFEPFEITLPVNFEERLMKSIQAWPLRIDRHSVWGEAICDQLKAHGIEV